MIKEFKPLISADTSLKEFTLRALLIGLVLAVVLGAANAYLGLKAGMTIAATYPAAVLGMALLRLFKDSNILEENLTRTVGSIGESIAAGAIFTIPGFLIAGVWSPELFASFEGYWKSTVIMLAGGIVGILFVTKLERILLKILFFNLVNYLIIKYKTTHENKNHNFFFCFDKYINITSRLCTDSKRGAPI